MQEGQHRRDPTVHPCLLTSPAGALSSTAADMSHFLIAQLQGGRYEAGRILSSAALWDTLRSTAAQLHYAAITIASMGFISYLMEWNLLGFHF